MPPSPSQAPACPSPATPALPCSARPDLQYRRTQGATAPAAAFFDDTRPRADARQLAARALAATSTAPGLRDDDDPGVPAAEHATLWMRQRRLALRNLVGTAHTLNLRTPPWT